MLLRAHNIFYARIHWQDLLWINYNVVPGNRLSDIKPNHFWPITYTVARHVMMKIMKCQREN